MIRRILFTLISVLATLSLSHAAGPVLAKPVTGSIIAPNGSPFNGTMRVQFPYAGAVDTTCTPNPCPIAPLDVKWQIVYGALPTYAQLNNNAAIVPSGTYYTATLYDAFMNPISQFQFAINLGLGGGAFDLGSAQQTAITTNNINLMNPASLSGNNTWVGTQSFTGPVSFSVSTTPVFGAGFLVNTGTPNFQAGFNVNGGTVTINGPVVTPSISLLSGGNNLQINSHLQNDGTAFKHVRSSGCTTTSTQFNTCNVTVTWPGTVFANTSYTPACTAEMNSGTAVITITAKVAGSMTVQVTNLLSGTAANVNLVDCTASHD